MHALVERGRNLCRALVLALGLGLTGLGLPSSASAASDQPDLAGAAGDGQERARIRVPSGQPISLSEVLLDKAPGALWARFRFVAPEIASQTSQGASATDIDHLCATLALPYLAHHDLHPERVVISLSDRALPFGQSAPEATQFFETYRIEGDACIWEGF
ncbi:DUF6497 family protein [Epibacterium sp. MM17-32]|uniref:DUF6497 family protein n=1 Tax=Epibacterium sp. MM17-32 TaxID=2917734 RepID=UPI001EF51CDF|nr:DUF6497 family protein [Epibacterium sp. MM17-32]MCG7627429.1 DUF6497 family protein [Epibacterium sp. MM17-32]